MGRYYFNIQDSERVIADPDGDDLPSAEHALAEIRETVADIRKFPHTYGEFAVWSARIFIVTDERGSEVMRVPVSRFS